MNSDYIKYVNLPQIPEGLLVNTIDDFSELKNIFIKDKYPLYKQYLNVNPDLRDWLQDTLHCYFFCSYQVIREGILVHKDFGRTECMNYILATGGENAVLNMYDDDRNLIVAAQVPVHKWHWLNVTKFHGAANLDTVRLSLTVDHYTRNVKDFC